MKVPTLFRERMANLVKATSGEVAENDWNTRNEESLEQVNNPRVAQLIFEAVFLERLHDSDMLEAVAAYYLDKADIHDLLRACAGTDDSSRQKVSS